MESDGVVSMNDESKESSLSNDSTTISTREAMNLLMGMSLNKNKKSSSSRSIISIGAGDPTLTGCFNTPKVVEEAVSETLLSHKFHGYAPTAGLLQARIAIAQYLSRDLPYELSSEDVFITCGCTQAIDVSMSLLARPGANILLPRPYFPVYKRSAAFRQLEVRHYDLLPEKGWEVDFDAVEALADQNTVALLITNPVNPCGNVFTYQHLEKIAKTAKKLGIIVVSDEIYGHLVFGANPFVPMGVFGSIVPVITLGSLSKRWLVPGWKLGWFVTNDPSGAFRKPEVVERIKTFFDILGGPASFMQAAVPHILTQTEEVFFRKNIDTLKHTSDICCRELQDIPFISFPCKPQGSLTMMAKLNLSLLEDISDDIDFCVKLAKEESVVIIPGTAVGLKDWLRITFAINPSDLQEGMKRIKSFYQRHAKKLM